LTKNISENTIKTKLEAKCLFAILGAGGSGSGSIISIVSLYVLIAMPLPSLNPSLPENMTMSV